MPGRSALGKGLLVAAILCRAARPLAAGPGQDTSPARYHIFVGDQAGRVVLWALDGAARRLSAPGCQRVFDDFTDETGRSLAADLADTGHAAAGALASLYFADARDSAQCRTNEAVAAFTAPRSRVVQICPTPFVHLALKPGAGDVLIIHEFLHTLGLGENPPASGEITNVVRQRCGGNPSEVQR